jgi:phosphoribosylamine--glycine ligase
MRVLVIGSGAREHAICWKLKQSKAVTEMFCAPGNPGIAQLAHLVEYDVRQIEELCAFAVKQKINLTVVGPEVPLSLGIVDLFNAAGLRVFGPTKAAARLEASKQFAKEVMIAAGVPTAEYKTLETRQQAELFVRNLTGPIVLKADGLAAGKGVVVCHTQHEAQAALPILFDELKAGLVVAEEFLEGVEASLIVAAHGTTFVPFATSHDYKRIFDNDAGPNTGGMGSISPTNHLTNEQEAWALKHVIKPMLVEMERRGEPFTGFLYAGLMISPKGQVKVLEFNARLGDPETQSIMRRLESDLDELLISLLDGRAFSPKWSAQSAACIVLAAGGYPGKLQLDEEITGLELAEQIPGVQIFHAGTARNKGSMRVAGGRVLSVTACGSDVQSARNLAYRAVDMIQFRGRQVRRDIGKVI